HAGASDQLRIEIIHLLGGTYTDGDNTITTQPRALTTLTQQVAAAPHAFTLHLIPEPTGTKLDCDVVIAPARHPAISLWRELFLASYLFSQPQLFGNIERMGQRYSRLPADQRWYRYTISLRAGRMHTGLFTCLGLAFDDPRVVRVAPVITRGSEMSWSRSDPPAPPSAAPPTPHEGTPILAP